MSIVQPSRGNFYIEQMQNRFPEMQESVTSDQVHVHYEPQKPVTLATDASLYGREQFSLNHAWLFAESFRRKIKKP